MHTSILNLSKICNLSLCQFKKLLTHIYQPAKLECHFVHVQEIEEKVKVFCFLEFHNDVFYIKVECRNYEISYFSKLHILVCQMGAAVQYTNLENPYCTPDFQRVKYDGRTCNVRGEKGVKCMMLHAGGKK